MCRRQMYPTILKLAQWRKYGNAGNTGALGP